MIFQNFFSHRVQIDKEFSFQVFIRVFDFSMQRYVVSKINSSYTLSNSYYSGFDTFM